MSITSSKVYTEVLELLRHIPYEEYYKIPNSKIEFFKNNMDIDYKFTINPEIDLSEQNISQEANAVIINLFNDYFTTEEQKVKIKEILDINQKKKEEEKREKYNPDDIFKKYHKENNSVVTTENNTSTPLVEYKESFFKKLKDFIFRIFHINE